MKEITKKWLKISDRDLKVAQTMFESKYWQHAVMMTHQAIEKVLKAYLAENGLEIQKIHNLVKVANQTKLEFSEADWIFIQELNPHYQPNRYPDISYNLEIKYTKSIAEKYVFNGKKLYQWLRQKIK